MKRIIRRPLIERYDAIVGSDLHLRDDAPVCRELSEYQEAQIRKMSFIAELCQRHQCPFLCAGDLFDHWKPSPWLISLALEHLPDEVITVAGQHDMQNHSLDLSRTGMETLRRTGRVMILEEGHRHISFGDVVVVGYAFGEVDPKLPEETLGEKRILLWHHLSCKDKQPWPGAGAAETKFIFEDLPQYNLIITGDNHQQFWMTDKFGKSFVNPGSMMRMTADQVDFEPAVFGWIANDNSITRIPLPIRKGVVNQEHLVKENKESRDVRMDAYIVRAKKTFENKLSFTKNLEKHFKTNKENKDVERLTWTAVKEEGHEQ